MIKLRPVVPSELPSDLRGSPNLVVEVAVMPGGYGCFASLKSQLPKPAVRAAALGEKPLRKGIDLSGEQQTKTKTALEFFSSELQAQRP